MLLLTLQSEMQIQSYVSCSPVTAWTSQKPVVNNCYPDGKDGTEHYLREEMMNESTEGQAISPGGGEVGDFYILGE